MSYSDFTLLSDHVKRQGDIIKNLEMERDTLLLISRFKQSFQDVSNTTAKPKKQVSIEEEPKTKNQPALANFSKTMVDGLRSRR